MTTSDRCQSIKGSMGSVAAAGDEDRLRSIKVHRNIDLNAAACRSVKVNSRMPSRSTSLIILFLLHLFLVVRILFSFPLPPLILFYFLFLLFLITSSFASPLFSSPYSSFFGLRHNNLIALPGLIPPVTPLLPLLPPFQPF